MEYAKSIMGDDLNKDSCFLDAGSGIGKATLAASLLFPFKRCLGIEILEQLDDAGDKLMSSFNFSNQYEANPLFFPNHVKKENEEEKILIPEVTLKQGDFADENWSQYSIVFVNSTAFEPELMKTVGRKSMEMKQGSLLITVTKRIPEIAESRWKLYDGFRQHMNFGAAVIYFHRVRNLKYESESKGEGESVFLSSKRN